MNKSKFKSVKFLPFDKQMVRYFASDGKAYWEVNKQVQTMRCYESTIEAYPELFEVEKAGREFEEGEYYWAKVWKWSDWDAVKYSHGVFYFVGVPTGFTPNRLYLIGGKIGR